MTCIRAFRRLAVLAILAASAIDPAAAQQTFIVGPVEDPRCQYDSLAAALDAAAANGPEMDRILLAQDQTSVRVAVFDHDVIIEGGFADCGLAPNGSGKTAVVGDGGGTVLQLTGETDYREVELHNLDITGGGDDGAGGGLEVRGSMRVLLRGVHVRGNTSRLGGGIYVERAVGQFSGIVELLEGTHVHENSASEFGGGIYAQGGAVRMRADRVVIERNSALYGGGIFCSNCNASVGMHGDETPRDDATGAVIRANTASQGGGVYVSGIHAHFGANELAIDDNVASSRGAGIYADFNASVSMRRDYLSAMRLNCPPRQMCNRLRGNRVGNGGFGTPGAAVYVTGHARVDLAQVLIADNVAANGPAAYLHSGTLNLEGALVIGNRSADFLGATSGVIRGSTDPGFNASSLRVAYSTFAGNVRRDAEGQDQMALDVSMQDGSNFAAFSTAFYDAPSPLQIAAGTIRTDCVAHWGAMGPGSHDRFLWTRGLGDPDGPHFSRPERGDFRLRTTAPLTDHCDAGAYEIQARDLLLQPRCTDDPNKTDGFGSCDIGAIESDHIFGPGRD